MYEGGNGRGLGMWGGNGAIGEGGIGGGCNGEGGRKWKREGQ